ncbi:ArnT family glycosyltransferase [Dictyobacter formicarum]|uniref:Dolichyl-phosphate-mannose--protein mannosyltransferase n=1 Tax=Dictyobacter formicarum TaxID=2778368 RepID=A0ABQ3VL55_9CHLR|nr:glycosyltransferase family 39 protein [Dictyobacter formicarum]GHO86088.1 dolichyl-phosphate-mannose--protein mannosyltransferase [Dictyobacter formicarum]
MIDTTAPVTNARPELRLEQKADGWQRFLQPVGLTLITLISIFMNFYQLGRNGYGNQYYAAAIRSMLDSWHNFFFVSFDPGGFVTVDKPPLGFWLQAASAKIFGFTPFSIFLPQALAGVLSVVLLYYLVRRHFGIVAGLLAALALAISPISVVTNRNNTIDSTLILVMLLGAWAVMKAAEAGKLRWLLLCAVCVGLGFNIKMLEAYLVVPAYGLLYLLAAPKRLWVRIVHLALAVLLMLTISLSWAVAVDMIPASQRPYVGSSQDNSEISLALGYNGVQRLLGSFGFGGRNAGMPGGNRTGQNPPAGIQGANSSSSAGTNGSSLQTGNGGFQGPPTNGGGNFGGGGFGGGGAFNTGTPGILRLFTQPLGGQIVWLLPLALLGMLALAWQRRPQFRDDWQQQSLILWGVWLLTVGIFFSVASFFHQYYLSTLAPAICALFGIGIVVMWQDYRRSGWHGWLLPLALILTAMEQIYIIATDPSWGSWLMPIIAIACALAAIILFLGRLLPRQTISTRLLLPAVGLGLVALLLTSAVWSAIPAVDNIVADLPTAGQSQGFGGGGAPGTGRRFTFDRQSTTSSQQAPTGGSGGPPANAGGNGGRNIDTALIKYLEANQGNTKYLLAVPSSQTADSIILSTNKAVMALGGFSGSDPILTSSQLKALVANGTVRYFLLNGSGGFGGGPGGQSSSATSWVTQSCKAVPSSQWQSSSSTNAGGFGGSSQLYDCKATS